ncbi:hypothetical protein [Sodaliphilus sp.]
MPAQTETRRIAIDPPRAPKRDTPPSTRTYYIIACLSTPLPRA